MHVLAAVVERDGLLKAPGFEPQSINATLS
jgi:hypothetical protein